MNGLLIIDKPGGITSHDVVARVRRICHERSVGHLGTLDPMATGVLPLALGSFTRLAQFYGDTSKAYEGTIRFGFATDTYDAEGDSVGEVRNETVLTLDDIRNAALSFTGTLHQTPPPFSAKKIKGVPAYKLARKKQEVELQPVEVEVSRFDVVSFSGDTAAFEAEVSSGTYIRSIAHDLGQKLGIGAHLASLRRTRVGEFSVAESLTLEQLDQHAQTGDLDSVLLHPRKLLAWMPAVTANVEQVAFIRNGRAVNLPEMSTAELVRVYASQRELVGVCRRIAGTLFQPKVVLAV